MAKPAMKTATSIPVFAPAESELEEAVGIGVAEATLNADEEESVLVEDMKDGVPMLLLMRVLEEDLLELAKADVAEFVACGCAVIDSGGVA